MGQYERLSANAAHNSSRATTDGGRVGLRPAGTRGSKLEPRYETWREETSACIAPLLHCLIAPLTPIT
jgi:hypothetical protein